MTTPRREEPLLRDALAFAIVKERRAMAEETERWRTRAMAAEAELDTLTASLRGTPSCDAFLRNLAELDACFPQTPTMTDAIDSTAKELQARRQALAVFLRNVHALRTAQVKHAIDNAEKTESVAMRQMMREQGKIGEEAWETTTVDLVCDFVTTSLVRLSPGKLRTEYAQHAAECFTVLTEASHKTKSSVDHTQRLKDLITAMVDGIVHDVTSPVCTIRLGFVHANAMRSLQDSEKWKNDAALEFLTCCLLAIPSCLAHILHKTSEAILHQIQIIAKSAHDLQKVKTASLSTQHPVPHQRDDQNSEHCEEYVQQSAHIWQKTQYLFQLQVGRSIIQYSPVFSAMM